MDQVSQHIFQIPSQFSQFQFSKKAIQIILPLSVFSFLISYSFLLPFLLHCFNAFSIQLFNYGSDRNCIFLFCNGILVFLIKSSGLISNPPLGNDINREHVKNNGDDQQSVRELSEMKALATEEVAMEVEEEQGQENGNLVAVVDAENGLLVTEAADEEDDEFIITEEEEEEGEEGIGLLSAEELNKKCDDFIKKMKEGIRIEAQQPILV